MIKIIFLILFIALAGGVVWYTSSDQGIENNVGGEERVTDNGIQGEDNGSLKDTETVMSGGNSTTGYGTYEDYSAEKLVLAESGDVLIFFHAPWCPICRAIEAEILASAELPAGVHILKVDFDTSIALRQKYGVTIQHTFVQVNAEGNAIQKFSNESMLEGVLSRIQ